MILAKECKKNHLINTYPNYIVFVLSEKLLHQILQKVNRLLLIVDDLGERMTSVERNVQKLVDNDTAIVQRPNINSEDVVYHFPITRTAELEEFNIMLDNVEFSSIIVIIKYLSIY